MQVYLSPMELSCSPLHPLLIYLIHWKFVPYSLLLPARTTVEHSRVSSQRGEDNKESPKSQRCSLHFLTPHMCCCRIREGEKSSLQQNTISFLGSSMYEALASFYQQLAHNLHGISRSASRTIYSTELEQLTHFVTAAGEVCSIAAFKKRKSLDDF